MIILALNSAAAEAGVTKEEGEAVLRTLLSFQARTTVWPKGFMD